MQVAYVRFALIFIATTIGASLDTYAASRVWVLNAVRFEDGAVARGSFSYDDVTRTFDYWSVRVSEGPRFPSLTYVPGNSATYYIPGWVYFVSSETAPTGLARFLNLWPSSPLDGQNATVPLDLSKSYESFEELIVRDQRKIVSGSLLLGGSPSAAAENTVVVVEYHNLSRDHYFMTALPGEIALLTAVRFQDGTEPVKSFVHCHREPCTLIHCQYVATMGCPNTDSIRISFPICHLNAMFWLPNLRKSGCSKALRSSGFPIRSLATTRLPVAFCIGYSTIERT